MIRTKTKLPGPTAANRVRSALKSATEAHWQERTEQACAWRLDGQINKGKPEAGRVVVKCYTNGTLYIEASNDTVQAWLNSLLDKAGVRFGTVPPSAQTASSTASDALVEVFPVIGSDESGKGDYFGPLVVAAVFVDSDKTARALREAGACDSKSLTATQVPSIAAAIREVLGSGNYLIWVPKDYNATYASYQAKNQKLNHLMADAHANTIARLREKHVALDSIQIVCDRFGTERFLIDSFKRAGITDPLTQAPRAESHVAVASASILARDRFVQVLGRLAEDVGTRLPLGGGPPAKAVMRQLARRPDAEAVLNRVAKRHFKIDVP